MNIEQELRSFAALSSESFTTPTESVINKAIQITKIGRAYNFICDPNPCDNGGIVLTFFRFNGDRFLDVEITPKIELNYCYERGKGSQYTELDSAENVSKKQIRRQLNLLKKDSQKDEISTKTVHS